MARILVLGGGKQGGVVAADLARDYAVTVADVRPPSIPGTEGVVADLADFETLVALIHRFDMAVGALPAALGFHAAKAAIAAKRDYVDLAFYPEDAYSLDAAAKEAGIAIVPDCGLAPGISNLIAGRAVAARPRSSIRIEVGGVAQDKNRDYGYVVTWSLPDLVDEYTRPARIRRNNEVVSLPVFAEMETIHIEGVGELESFLTDGCRTLLSLAVPEVVEKTLRWPGHVDAIKPLVAEGRLVEEFAAKCMEGEDVVVFRVQADDDVVTMVDHAQGGLSAMARTTALTCAAFVRWVATGKLKQIGVVAPERIGADPEAYRFIITSLGERNIVLQNADVFMGEPTAIY